MAVMMDDEPLFAEAVAGIQSLKCGICDWEMVYACPEESELAIACLNKHAKDKHYRKFDEVYAKIEIH